MITLATIAWFLSGIVGFFFNIGKLIKFAEEIFYVGEEFFKYTFYVASFIAHVVGGLITFAYAVYLKLKG